MFASRTRRAAGGLIVFQAIPWALHGDGAHLESPVSTPAGTYSIDMNVFPRDDVESALRTAGACRVHAFDDGSGGDVSESLLYVAIAGR